MGNKVPNKQASSSYSMAYRPLTGGFAEDLAKTPGPGRYNAIGPDVYTPRAPKYSMLGRSYMPGGMANYLQSFKTVILTIDNTIKPGPGTYCPENVYLNKKQAPKHSLGIKHSEFITPLIVEIQQGP